MRQQHAAPDTYADAFAKALKLDAQHAWAHIMMGLALYERDGDVAGAEGEFAQALDLASDGRWVYYYRGEVYRQEGRADEAVDMYRRALELKPDFHAVKKSLRVMGLDPDDLGD